MSISILVTDDNKVSVAWVENQRFTINKGSSMKTPFIELISPKPSGCIQIVSNFRYLVPATHCKICVKLPLMLLIVKHMNVLYIGASHICTCIVKDILAPHNTLAVNKYNAAKNKACTEVHISPYMYCRRHM